MSFSGTQQKCKACDKTVHFVEGISVDGVIYHKNCFRCSHCNGHLVISNYSSADGVLYCKVHYEQLFRETGSYPKKLGKPPSELNRTPSKLSAFFSGTQEKCSKCNKTVYPLEKLTVEGEFYHKSCFRCAHGGCFLTPSTYAALDGYLYCKPHFSQLFKEKGSYSYLSKQTSIKRGEMQKEQEKEAEEKTKTTEDDPSEAEAEPEPEPVAEAEPEPEPGPEAEAEPEAETTNEADEDQTEQEH